MVQRRLLVHPALAAILVLCALGCAAGEELDDALHELGRGGTNRAPTGGGGGGGGVDLGGAGVGTGSSGSAVGGEAGDTTDGVGGSGGSSGGTGGSSGIGGTAGSAGSSAARDAGAAGTAGAGGARDAGAEAAPLQSFDGGGASCGAKCSIRLQYEYVQTPREDVASTLRVRVDAINTSNAGIALNRLTMRYWYTDPATGGEMASCYSAKVGCANITTQFVPLAAPRPGADRYFEIGFASGAGTLAVGANVGTISFGVQHRAGGKYTQTDDYSYDPNIASLADFAHVTAYVDGMLAWGTEP